MQMKSLLKQLIPPLLFKVIKRTIPHPRIFKTYGEAVAACQDNGYQNADLVKVVIDKNINFKKYIESNAVFDLGTLRTLIALGLSKESTSLNVIDFGGGGGYHYTIAQQALGKGTTLKWNVVETTAMANEAQRIANNNLKFFDSITEAEKDLGSVDLIFTSGALQYCPNPLAFLKQLTETNAKYLFITRTAFSETDNDIFSIQVSKLSSNGPGPLPTGYTDKKMTYPITCASKSAAESILREKYDIQFVILEDKAAYIVADKEIDMFGYFCVRKSLTRQL